MTFPVRPQALSIAPRHWLSRRAGECAFPVGGEGVDLVSCCRPCGRGAYCPGHEALMHRPSQLTRAQFERAVLALAGRRP